MIKIESITDRSVQEVQEAYGEYLNLAIEYSNREDRKREEAIGQFRSLSLIDELPFVNKVIFSNRHSLFAISVNVYWSASSSPLGWRSDRALYDRLYTILWDRLCTAGSVPSTLYDWLCMTLYDFKINKLDEILADIARLDIVYKISFTLLIWIDPFDTINVGNTSGPQINENFEIQRDPANWSSELFQRVPR